MSKRIAIAASSAGLAALAAWQTLAQGATPLPDMATRQAQVTCIGVGGKAGRISLTRKGQVMFGSVPLFASVYGNQGLKAYSVVVIGSPGSPQRLLLGIDPDRGGIEGAIVEPETGRVISPGLLGPRRVRGLAPARDSMVLAGTCEPPGTPGDHGWMAFGNGRYLIGSVGLAEGESGITVVDLQTARWSYWKPPSAAYPATRGPLPSGQSAKDLMIYWAEPSKTRVSSANAQTGQVTLTASFSFSCNPWRSLPAKGSDPCIKAGIPDPNEEQNKSPELRKTYKVTLQLSR